MSHGKSSEFGSAGSEGDPPRAPGNPGAEPVPGVVADDGETAPPGPKPIVAPEAAISGDSVADSLLSPAATAAQLAAGLIEIGFLQASTAPDSLGRLAHYEIVALLGRGAFGTVFQAFDTRLHRHVAIKVLDPQLAVTSPPRKRFLREARSAAAVRHENVVQVYGVEDQPLPYLVMEYIDGVTLQQRLDETGPLEVSEVLNLGRQLARGLAAAHALGLIHRDIKPGNILIESGPAPRIKITDFGLARAADDASMTRTGTIAGTPMYMAPEQAQGTRIDHRTDLFSLGSVLYQMASGRPPFRASTTFAVLKRVVEETPRPIPEIVPEVPTWLCAVIQKLQAKDPDHRFQSADALLAALESSGAPLATAASLPDQAPAAASARPPSAPSPAAPEPAVAVGRPPSLARLVGQFLAYTCAVTLATAAVLAFLSYRADPPDPTSQVGPGPAAAEPRAPEPAGGAGLVPVTAGADERLAAQWVQEHGGTLKVLDKGRVRDLAPTDPLPPEDWTVLGVSWLNRVDWQTESLALLKRLPNLASLDLFECQLPDPALDVLAELPKLRTLMLQRVPITDENVGKIARLKDLVELNLIDTFITDRAIPQLAGLAHLEVLKLGNTGVRGQNLELLSGCPNLREIDLAHLHLTPGWADRLSRVRSLRSVILHSSNASDDEVAQLSGLGLQALDLLQTSVTDRGLAALARIVTLKSVIVRESAVSVAGVEALQARLGPKAEIQSGANLPVRLGEALATGTWTPIDLKQRQPVTAMKPGELVGEMLITHRKVFGQPIDAPKVESPFGEVEVGGLRLAGQQCRLIDFPQDEVVVRLRVRFERAPDVPLDEPRQAMVILQQEPARGVAYTLHDSGAWFLGRADFGPPLHFEVLRPAYQPIPHDGPIPATEMTIAVTKDDIRVWNEGLFHYLENPSRLTRDRCSLIVGWGDPTTALVIESAEYQLLK